MRRGVFPGGASRLGQLPAQKVVESDEVVILAGVGDGAVELDIGQGGGGKVAALVVHLL
ncbi:hypothetical protein D3C72_2183910 [compost metagenome]